MNKQKRQEKINLKEERGSVLAGGDAAVENLLWRLRDADQRMMELASHIPTFTPEQIHTLISSRRMSQFELRRQADRYLLVFCLFVLALAASLLWHTAPAGPSPLNVAVLVLAVADAVVALRAARGLWLMRQTLRLRHRPYRMARYADRLSRLSRRRRRWLGFVLAGSYNSVSEKDHRWLEFFSLRLPSYSIAACLFMLIALNADKAFAATRDYVNVTTTTAQTTTAICDTVDNIIQQL